MGGKWSRWFARITRRCSDVALLRMNLLYISLPEILVFSDAYYFFENIVNMKKIGKILVIRHLWFSGKMVALRKIYSCTTIGIVWISSATLVAYCFSSTGEPSIIVEKRYYLWKAFRDSNGKRVVICHGLLFVMSIVRRGFIFVSCAPRTTFL